MISLECELQVKNNTTLDSYLTSSQKKYVIENEKSLPTNKVQKSKQQKPLYHPFWKTLRKANSSKNYVLKGFP